jgi:hypothetical protein
MPRPGGVTQGGVAEGIEGLRVLRLETEKGMHLVHTPGWQKRSNDCWGCRTPLYDAFG